jgi:hypothetical protein
MKIIGKNSLSQYMSYLLFALFIFFIAQFIYVLIGFAVSYYNLKTGNQILSDFFIIGKDVGWGRTKWIATLDEVMKYKFYVPFTEQNLQSGLFTLSGILNQILGAVFINLFFYCSYNFFKEISQENVFNKIALLWLKRFGWLNIIYTALTFIMTPFSTKSVFAIGFFSIIFLFFGALILFIVEFFKKGLELQNQADLTI